MAGIFASIMFMCSAFAAIALPLYGMYCVLVQRKPGGELGFGERSVTPLMRFIGGTIVIMGIWSIREQKRVLGESASDAKSGTREVGNANCDKKSD